MTARKKKRVALVETDFDEAVARLIQTNPAELAEVMTRELTERMKESGRRIRQAREEIERGARSGKKPFSL